MNNLQWIEFVKKGRDIDMIIWYDKGRDIDIYDIDYLYDNLIWYRYDI